MSNQKGITSPVQKYIWTFLQEFTPARIARGHAGHSLPTKELLLFQADHAQARDAVYSSLELATFQKKILHPTIVLTSQITERTQYLQRPDLGRKLSDSSNNTLQVLPPQSYNICIVVADGLSAKAINHHAIPVVNGLISVFQTYGWSVAPVCLVQQGRVAIADEIAVALHAEIVLILIGERPGLSSPDSMGAYITYQPEIGITDERRNCVSNIRPEGLNYEMAIEKIVYLLREMSVQKISGVNLKDEMQNRLEQ